MIGLSYKVIKTSSVTSREHENKTVDKVYRCTFTTQQCVSIKTKKVFDFRYKVLYHKVKADLTKEPTWIIRQETMV